MTVGYVNILLAEPDGSSFVLNFTDEKTVEFGVRIGHYPCLVASVKVWDLSGASCMVRRLFGEFNRDKNYAPLDYEQRFYGRADRIAALFDQMSARYKAAPSAPPPA